MRRGYLALLALTLFSCRARESAAEAKLYEERQRELESLQAELRAKQEAIYQTRVLPPEESPEELSEDLASKKAKLEKLEEEIAEMQAKEIELRQEQEKLRKITGSK